MRPHPQDFHRALRGVNLIDEPVLNINSAGIRACKITHQLLIGRWALKRVFFENGEKLLRLWPKIGARNSSRIFLRLWREQDAPTHQPGFAEAFPKGSRIPRRIDARILGIDKRCSVSCTLRQSSSEISTPLARLPVIWIGS